MSSKTFPIYWDDLTIETQRNICASFNTDEEYEEGNSEIDPLFIIERETNGT